MTVDVVREGGELTLVPDGRLDSTTAGDLEDVLAKELDGEVKSLSIDLTGVDFISSKGLRVLVGAYKTMKGRQMSLTGANQSVLDVLRLSGLLRIFMVK